MPQRFTNTKKVLIGFNIVNSLKQSNSNVEEKFTPRSMLDCRNLDVFMQISAQQSGMILNIPI